MRLCWVGEKKGKRRRPEEEEESPFFCLEVLPYVEKKEDREKGALRNNKLLPSPPPPPPSSPPAAHTYLIRGGGQESASFSPKQTGSVRYLSPQYTLRTTCRLTLLIMRGGGLGGLGIVCRRRKQQREADGREREKEVRGNPATSPPPLPPPLPDCRL